MRPPVDLARYRAALSDLDALAAAHPELLSDEAQRRLAGDLPALLEDEGMTKDESTTLRLPEGTLARAEALVPTMQDWPGMRAARVSRSTVVREALLRGLDALEREAKQTPKGAK